MERELRGILETFAASGWDELAVPARRFLAGELTAPALRAGRLRKLRLRPRRALSPGACAAGRLRAIV